MMEKLFQHPGWLKVFSVIGAILLWAYVMPNYTKDTTKTFYDVPIIIKPNPNFEAFEGLDPKATVQIQAGGKGLAVNRLKREELSAVVDLSQVTESGKPTTVNVDVVGPQRVNYVVTPSNFTVTLIEKRSENVPVSVEPASRMLTINGRDYVYTAKPERDTVTLYDRSDYLNRVKQAVVTLDAAELSPGLESITKPAIPQDAAGKEVEKLARPSVVVNLDWEELPPGASFKIQPNTQGALPPGFALAKMEAEPAATQVRATSVKGRLPQNAVIPTAPIDLTGKTKTFSATVRLVPPEGVTTTIETVNVKVYIDEIQLDKVFQGVPLKVVGQATNADVAASVQDVEIRVKGPYSVLSSLDASVLHPYVDLEGIQAGKQTLPVKFNVPPGVSEIIVNPAFVGVTITPR
jgi:YbbR domain-containing protein